MKLINATTMRRMMVREECHMTAMMPRLGGNDQRTYPGKTTRKNVLYRTSHQGLILWVNGVDR